MFFFCNRDLELVPPPDDFVRLALRFPVVVVRFVLLHGRKDAERLEYLPIASIPCVGLGLVGGETSEQLDDPDSSSPEKRRPLSLLDVRLILTLGLGLGDCFRDPETFVADRIPPLFEYF